MSTLITISPLCIGSKCCGILERLTNQTSKGSHLGFGAVKGANIGYGITKNSASSSSSGFVGSGKNQLALQFYRPQKLLRNNPT